MNQNPARAVRAAVTALALIAAACGGGDAPEAADTEPDVASDVTATTTTIATTTPTATSPGSPPSPSPGSANPVASRGCGSSDVVPVVEAERHLSVDGTDRRYLLTVPAAHDGTEPLPVVFDFHGLMEGADVHARMSEYSALAEEEGFVAVFPHGTGDPVHWDVSPAEGNTDLAYFDALVEHLGSELCVDTTRIYATGLSNGAMLTSTLVCARSHVLAAAAPVAGILDHPGCSPSRPVPVVAFHGTEDPILRFNGGVDVSALPGAEAPSGPPTTRPPIDLDGPGHPAAVAAFAERNGCRPEPADTELTAEVVHRVFDCPPGADVEFYIVIGGGHTWPSSQLSASLEDLLGPTTFDIDATEDAWEFLSRFSSS